MDDLLISCFQLKDLDIAIVKATNHVESPPKERHIASEFMKHSSPKFYLYIIQDLLFMFFLPNSYICDQLYIHIQNGTYICNIVCLYSNINLSFSYHGHINCF